MITTDLKVGSVYTHDSIFYGLRLCRFIGTTIDCRKSSISIGKQRLLYWFEDINGCGMFHLLKRSIDNGVLAGTITNRVINDLESMFDLKSKIL